MKFDTTVVLVQRLLDVPMPEYKTDKCAGFDLATAEEIRLTSGESGFFRTGLVIQAPEDHMLLITPRSSTWKKYGVSLGNTIGIVDEDYCGPDDELLLNVSKPAGGDRFSPTVINAGTRIAQGIFVPITRASIFLESVGPIAATRGGWGSTGV
jgi:dUTP pyrophosphatase